MQALTIIPMFPEWHKREINLGSMNNWITRSPKGDRIYDISDLRMDFSKLPNAGSELARAVNEMDFSLYASAPYELAARKTDKDITVLKRFSTLEKAKEAVSYYEGLSWEEIQKIGS